MGSCLCDVEHGVCQDLIMLVLIFLLQVTLGLELNDTISMFSFSTASISLKYNNSSCHSNNRKVKETFEARFASGAPDVNVAGSLFLPPTPLSKDACQKASDSDMVAINSPREHRIILIKRGNCSFDQKVANIMPNSNLGGIIVYNDEPSIKLKTIYVTNSSVPMVFITLANGEHLSSLLENDTEVNVVIAKDSYCEHNNVDGLTKCIRHVSSSDHNHGENVISQWDIVCISVALFLLTAFSLVCFLFYYLRKLRRVQKIDQKEQKLVMMARKAVARLELRKVTEIDSNLQGDCPVCLDQVLVGAEVRTLPCGHVYHRKCIDKWLIRKRKCPLCKYDILQHFKCELGDSESDS